METHKAVFRWFGQVLSREGLLDAQTVAIDATTLEANAAMRSIGRRESGRSDEEYLKELAQAEEVEEPAREQLARLDRKRKKKASNQEWMSPTDPDARIAKMKDGRTHLARKAGHTVDLASGAIAVVTLQAADQGDTTTVAETLQETQAQAELVSERGVEEVMAGRGHHSGAVLIDCAPANRLHTTPPSVPDWRLAGLPLNLPLDPPADPIGCNVLPACSASEAHRAAIRGRYRNAL